MLFIDSTLSKIVNLAADLNCRITLYPTYIQQQSSGREIARIWKILTTYSRTNFIMRDTIAICGYRTQGRRTLGRHTLGRKTLGHWATPTVKHLGFRLDNSLIKQVDHVKPTCYNKLRTIAKMKNFLNKTHNVNSSHYLKLTRWLQCSILWL